MAREPHHFQYAESASHERVAAARKQIDAQPGASRLTDVDEDAVAAAEHGVVAATLTKPFDR